MEKHYKSWLVNLKDRGFVFFNFKDYIDHKENNLKLPEKLIVLRHDIHTRDFINTYKMINIENEVFGTSPATYFVQYNFHPANINRPTEHEREQNETVQNTYIDIINTCIKYNIDVQPHISPMSMYLTEYNPEWQKLTYDDTFNLFHENYDIKFNRNDFVPNFEFIVKNEDFLNINNINKEYIKYISNYFKEWEQKFGFYPIGFSEHGAGIHMSNPKNFPDNIILDQNVIIESKCFKYFSNSQNIYKYLKYLTDNYLAPWMKDPNVIEDIQYQVLVHPKQWDLI